MPPTPANGKVCYVEIPAVDIPASAEFYERVFGWRVPANGATEPPPSTTPPVRSAAAG